MFNELEKEKRYAHVFRANWAWYIVLRYGECWLQRARSVKTKTKKEATATASMTTTTTTKAVVALTKRERKNQQSAHLLNQK